MESKDYEYLVKVNYTDYLFSDRDTAITFAEVAARHICPKDYQDREVTVTVSYSGGYNE